MDQLQDKVAIVTGAGQGVGRGIALALGNAGASIVVVDRIEERAERTVAELEARGVSALAQICDVSKRDQVEAVVTRTADAFGTVHILVNNAHAARPMVRTEDTTDKDMAVAMKGLYGAWYFMQACFPYLKQERGKVINLGALSAIRGDEGFMAYAAAKEAIRGMSRVAAREWGSLGIAVNVVCPLSDSPGIDYMIENAPEFISALTEATALKRLGSSEREVGATVVFLASADGNYITGQTINVDGGSWIAP